MGKTSKIFIDFQGDLVAFLWADLGSDGTVMIGIPARVRSNVLLILDCDREYRPEDLHEETLDAPVEKISFHPSGYYKMSGIVGKTKGTKDRITVKGPPLAEIKKPRRMMDFMLPTTISAKKEYSKTNKDIVLVAPKEDKPLRCTVFCMSHEEFDKLFDEKTGEPKIRFVSNSTYEAFHALESNDHVWVFVLRASSEDKEFPDRLIIHLAGEPRWGYSLLRRVIFKLTNFLYNKHT